MKRPVVLGLCALGLSSEMLRAQMPPVPVASASCRSVNMSVFRLDDYLKKQGFVAEKKRGGRFGSYAGISRCNVPTANERWFRGEERLEYSVLVFPDARTMDAYDEGQQVNRQARWSLASKAPLVNGMRSADQLPNLMGASTLSIYKTFIVGRVYMAVFSVRSFRHPSASLPRVTREVQHRLVVAAKKWS